MTASQFRRLRRKIRFRRFTRRWRFLLILALLVVLGAMAYGGKWAYGKFLNRQAYAFTSKAAEDFARGDFKRARMSVSTALRLSPGHPAATRMLARIQAVSGERLEALTTFQQLADERQMGLDELKLYASLASENGEDELANRLIKVVAENGDPAFPHLLQAQNHLKEKKMVEAEAAIRAAVQAAPSDATQTLLLDFLIANSKQGQTITESALIIKDLSARDNAYGARALATGLRTGFMNPLERDEWTEKLRSHPHVNIHQRIYADSLSIFKKPDAKPAIVAQLVEFAKNRSITDRAAAAEWLSKNGAPAEALSILPLEEALKRADTFLVWLDTNALLRNFSPCLDALARPENPLPPVHSKLFRALALKQLGRATESQAAFAEAISEAGNDPGKFAFVTAYLFGANENALFEASLAKIPDQSAVAPAVFQTLYPSVLKKYDAELSLRILDVLATSSIVARSPAFQNELTYQRTLLGKPTSLKFLRKNFEENPDNLNILATLAFHELKSGNPAAAMALFDGYGPDVDARSLPPRILTIFSATLAANGKTELSRKAASLIPRGSLSKQEAEFLTAQLKPESPSPKRP